MINPPLWKATIACIKTEAGDLAAALELEGSAQAVLIAEEPFADGAVVKYQFNGDSYQVLCTRKNPTPPISAGWRRAPSSWRPCPTRTGFA